MSLFHSPINLLRYQIRWRVNSSLVWLHAFPAVDATLVLGTIIAQRLASRAAGPWQKALAPLKTYFDTPPKQRAKVALPAVAWPVESVLFFAPGKRTHGPGECITWYLTLAGKEADHNLFLELILPAMEEAGYTNDPQWKKRNRLWGNFDIDAVYVARGRTWEPVVQEGKLDIKASPTPAQWLEGLLPIEKRHYRHYRRIAWQSPFDFSGLRETPENLADLMQRVPLTGNWRRTPTLAVLLLAFIERINLLMYGKRSHLTLDLQRLLREEALAPFLDAVRSADAAQSSENSLHTMPNFAPGYRTGTQIYQSIPAKLLPYLELAAIIHLGRQTQFGCGTFALS